MSQSNTLHELFKHQLELATELKQALTKEYEALKERDLSVIEEINQQKSEKTKLLEALAKDQQNLLATAGQPNSNEGLNNFTASLPQQQAAILDKQKKQLQTVLGTCQELNQINGGIIAANKQSAETALAILRGQISPNNVIYNAGGKAISDNTSNPLSKA